MIYLLDTSQDYDQCAAELGVDPSEVGQLITPRTRFANRGRRSFAIDNGGFKGQDPAGLLSLLTREEPNRERCLFVVVPDVPFDARRTLEVFERWAPRLRGMGYPLALAMQEGQDQLPIPWEELSAVFIGGRDSFKVGPHAEAIIRAAHWLGKHVHVGRVNDALRLKWCRDMGVHSVDGSGISQHTRQRIAIRGYRPDEPHAVLDLAPAGEARGAL